MTIEMTLDRISSTETEDGVMHTLHFKGDIGDGIEAGLSIKGDASIVSGRFGQAYGVSDVGDVLEIAISKSRQTKIDK